MFAILPIYTFLAPIYIPLLIPIKDPNCFQIVWYNRNKSSLSVLSLIKKLIIRLVSNTLQISCPIRVEEWLV